MSHQGYNEHRSMTQNNPPEYNQKMILVPICFATESSSGSSLQAYELAAYSVLSRLLPYQLTLLGYLGRHQALCCEVLDHLFDQELDTLVGHLRKRFALD